MSIANLLPKGYPTEEERAASEAMLDVEFQMENQARLPEDLRYGGLYGLLSYLGLMGQGDDAEASIKSMGMARPGETQQFAGSLGQYYLPDATKLDISEYLGGLGRKSLPYYGGEAPKPDQVRFFQSTDPYTREEAGERMIRSGPGGIGGIDDVPKYIAHELAHRATNLPFLKDLLSTLDPDSEEYKDLKKLIRNDHYYIKALDRKYGTTPSDKRNIRIYGDTGTYDTQKKLRELRGVQDTIKEYLTPERQEELGVRLPTPAAEPKSEVRRTIERAIDYARDIF
tara:strand:- start:58 stop:909 length:852 start_codon:yes stop_codon:yes gene_type:complete